MGKITYGQLSKTLTGLGFTESQRTGYLVFFIREADALIALPNVSPRAVVRPAHMLMVKSTVVGRGVATEEEFLHAVNATRPPRLPRGAKV